MGIPEKVSLFLWCPVPLAILISSSRHRSNKYFCRPDPYVCVYVCMYVCMYMYVYVCMYVCVYVCMYICMYMYVCMVTRALCMVCSV
jgi:hypothetical protein